MISVNGNSWEETEVNKRLVQKIKQDFKFSENISKLLCQLTVHLVILQICNLYAGI